jgi:hypothetical protein
MTLHHPSARQLRNNLRAPAVRTSDGHVRHGEVSGARRIPADRLPPSAGSVSLSHA